jgi:hypothetical protein
MRAERPAQPEPRGRRFEAGGGNSNEADYRVGQASIALCDLERCTAGWLPLRLAPVGTAVASAGNGAAFL